MNQIQEALVKVLACSLDELSLGKRFWNGSRGKLGQHARVHFSKINEAIVGARNLGVLPTTLPKFSAEEVFVLGNKVRSLGALNMSDQIRDALIEAFRERGFPEEILSAISSSVAELAKSIEE